MRKHQTTKRLAEKPAVARQSSATETTQPINHAMRQGVVEVFMGFDETANLPWSKPK
jgi:hypothetical protein